MYHLLANSVQDWTQFFVGLSAFLGTLWALVKWAIKVISRRNKRDIESAFDTKVYQMIRDTLQGAADRAGPRNTRVLDVHFIANDVTVKIPVIRDTWLTVLPGCEIMGDEFAEDRTTYFLRCSNTARIRRHTHEGSESVLVIKGKMRDLATGNLHLPGDTWNIPAGVVHSVHFESPDDNTSHGLFLITVTPPLPSSSQVLLQLEGLVVMAG